MERQNRFDYYKPLTISMVIVGAGLILASLILLPRTISNDKSDEIKKEEGHVHTPHNPEHPNVETSAKERAGAESKQKGNTVSTSTSPHPSDPHQDKGQLGNNPFDQDESEPMAEGVILDEKDYLDENGNVINFQKWCLARMHKNGWFKPEDIPIIYEEPNGHPDGVYIWTEFKEGGGMKFEDAPEEVKARNKALKEALDYATETGDGREVVRITKELGELHRPYKYPSMVTRMHLGSVPLSWAFYFNSFYEAVDEAGRRELKQRSGR